MPKYDAKNFTPAAPVAYVTLRNTATGASLSDVPMLIDTGADVTLLPTRYVSELEIETEADKVYAVLGFAGETSLLRMANLEVIFLGKKFAGRFLLVDQGIGILGRNVLNSVSILFDGPNKMWEEYKH